MRGGARRTLLEAVLIVVVGLTLGLAANATTARGIRLGTNYFPARQPSPVVELSPPAASSAPVGGGEQAVGAVDENGYQVSSHAEVMELYQSEAYLEERFIFIDARNDDDYAEAHIPGAFLLDHYRADRYLDEVVSAGENAEIIVTYCNGGKCEDSRLVAGDLIDAGVDPAKIHVYGGGVEQWKAEGLPFEQGERLSRDLVYLRD